VVKCLLIAYQQAFFIAMNRACVKLFSVLMLCAKNVSSGNAFANAACSFAPAIVIVLPHDKKSGKTSPRVLRKSVTE